METSKILSADLLDLLFDERNKDYGAYMLRKTYNQRIKKALVITFSVAGLILAGSVLASTMKTKENARLAIMEVTLETITEEPEPLPEPEPEPPQEAQVRTEQFVNLRITEDEQVTEPPPAQDDLTDALIGDKKLEGVDASDVVEPPLPEVERGIVEVKPKEPAIWEKVEVDARYDGNWEKFLLKNLRPDVPVDNGAPPGKHKVIIKFVVDVDGTVSDIKPLTNVGYGMEEEAVRVLKKAQKWIPAFQNTQHVKAYRTQAITFEVYAEE